MIMNYAHDNTSLTSQESCVSTAGSGIVGCIACCYEVGGNLGPVKVYATVIP